MDSFEYYRRYALNLIFLFHDFDFPCSLRYHHASPTNTKRTIGTVMAAMVVDETLASAVDETVSKNEKRC